VKPSWSAVEAARVEEGMKVEPAMRLLGMSRSSYYRQVRGMTDYQPKSRQRASMEHRDVLKDVALRRPEAGHRKVRAYAVAWQHISAKQAGASRMSCYRVLKGEGLIQPGRPAVVMREIRDRRRQMLEIPKDFNEVLQGDFTDYETEDGESYHIGGVTEYLSRFNLVSKVLDTETAFDLIDVTERAMREIANVGHTLPKRIVLVTDNGPAMKSRRYRNFIQKTDLLIHIRGQKYHPQTIGREERFHGSLKLEWLYRYLPKNRQELVERVAEYRSFYNAAREGDSEFASPRELQAAPCHDRESERLSPAAMVCCKARRSVRQQCRRRSTAFLFSRCPPQRSFDIQ
jgi:transposase InsO family protein